MATIKVTETTRDHVNALGARTGQTADQVVERSLHELERTLFWQQYDAAARAVAADPVASAEEAADQAVWDRTSRDGLERG